MIVEHRGHFASVSEYGLFFTILAQRHPPVYSFEARMGRVYINTRNEYVRGFLATLEPLVRAGLGKLKVDMSLYGAWKIEEEIKKRLQPGIVCIWIFRLVFPLPSGSGFGGGTPADQNWLSNAKARSQTFYDRFLA
ncbi:hypothetical protein V8E55_004097 [Tylopilus felleus]